MLFSIKLKGIIDYVGPAGSLLVLANFPVQ